MPLTLDGSSVKILAVASKGGRSMRVLMVRRVLDIGEYHKCRSRLLRTHIVE